MTSTAQESLLAGELAAVRGEQVRIDAKCSTLAALAGVALVLLVALVGDRDAPVMSRVLLGISGVVLTAAAVVLLGVLRPKLGGGGFNRYARMTGEDIRRELIVDQAVEHRRFLADELVVLSRITLAKQVRLRLATTLLTSGVLGIAVAMLATVMAGVTT